MSQTIVPSITDEVIAEIESSAKRVTLGGLGWYTELQLDDAIESSDDIDFMAKMTPDAALRLIARLRAAEKDAERYRFIRNEDTRPGFLASDPDKAKWLDEYLVCGEKMDAKIDLEMERSK